jgi:glutamine amidotransferase
LKVPQIGWNLVKQIKEDQLFQEIPDDSYFYFVNSYYVNAEEDSVLGLTDYGTRFASVIRKDNFYGVQFHPEKSGEIGLKLLLNFYELC